MSSNRLAGAFLCSKKVTKIVFIFTIAMSDKEDNPNNNEPIFLRRGDGLGWTLNFDRPISYLILAITLALICAGIYCAFFLKG
jgi:hypothetical protein